MKLHYLEILKQCFIDLENLNKDSSMVKSNFNKFYDKLKTELILSKITKNDINKYMIFNNAKKYIVLDVDEKDKYIKLKEMKMYVR